MSKLLGISVLHNAPALMAYIDPQERYLFANNAYREWYGVDPKEILGRTIRSVMGDANYRRLKPYIVRTLAGEAVLYEQALITRTGPRYVQGSYSPDLAEDGTVQGFFVHVSDISERRALELRLKESETRFARAFQSAGIGMALVSREGRFLQVNPALCAMLGYAEDEFYRLTFQDLTHPDDLAESLAASRDLVNGLLATHTVEKRYIHKGGHLVHTILSVSLARDSDGLPLHFIAQIQDITDRKIAEDRLFREHELSQVTLRSIGDGVITTDIAGAVTSLNPVAEHMTGWRAEDAVGRPLGEVVRLAPGDGTVTLPSSLRRPHGATDGFPRGLEADLVWQDTNTLLLRRDGTVIPVEETMAPIRNRSGATVGEVLVFHDMTRQRALTSQLAYQALHDALTDLPNRTLFRDRLDQAIARAEHTGEYVAVVFGDLDRLKLVNDTLGHAAGDELIMAVAKRLGTFIGEGGTVSRWAGDEFAILLSGLPDEATAAATAGTVAEQAIAAIGENFHVAGAELPINAGISFGISLYPRDGGSGGALMQAADVALYEVKRNRKGSYQFFSQSMNDRARERTRIEAMLRQATRSGNFELEYQPRIDLTSRLAVGAEALVRLRDTDELISPSRFIRIAEETGLVVSIGWWVIEQVCRQLREWTGTELGTLTLSLNVSPMQARRDDFHSILLATTAKYGVDPSRIELEITESTLVEPGPAISACMEKLKEAGFSIALDDFGTGYSSFSYLNRLPFDALKIDRSFIHDVNSPQGAVVVEAILALGRALGKAVVAEGVEAQAQLDWLVAKGCEEAQGYFFCPPVPAGELGSRLRAQGLLPKAP